MAEEIKRAVQKFYPYLVKAIPMSELTESFFSRPSSRQLLSIDQKAKLDSLLSPEEKTKYFLDEILIRDLTVGFTGRFDEMIVMMKESDDVLAKILVRQLMPDVSATSSMGDYDDTQMEISFNEYKDVIDAYDRLFSICQHFTIAKVQNETHFKIIRNLCVGRYSGSIHDSIKAATDIYHLFEIFSVYNDYCNWIDVKFLEVMANATNNERLQLLIENYKDMIYSKPLGEVWKGNPLHLVARHKYYDELKVTFEGNDSDSMTVEDLIKRNPSLARNIALLIYDHRKDE